MASKNVLLQMKIEDVLTDILVQTGSDNVIVDTTTNKTLTTYLSEIVAKINNVQGSVTNETQIKGWIVAPARERGLKSSKVSCRESYS